MCVCDFLSFISTLSKINVCILLLFLFVVFCSPQLDTNTHTQTDTLTKTRTFNSVYFLFQFCWSICFSLWNIEKLTIKNFSSFSFSRFFLFLQLNKLIARVHKPKKNFYSPTHRQNKYCKILKQQNIFFGPAFFLLNFQNGTFRFRAFLSRCVLQCLPFS